MPQNSQNRPIDPEDQVLNQPTSQLQVPEPIKAHTANVDKSGEMSKDLKQRPVSAMEFSEPHSIPNDLSHRSLTPNTTRRVAYRRPSYSGIESTRESYYNLDYPEDTNEALKLQLDPQSRFYARSRPRLLVLQSMLPYETELLKDQAKFLSHIVSHLYIAVKTLDIQGTLSVNAKDLAELRNESGFSDLDVVLETNLFEINNERDASTDDDSHTYLPVDAYDVFGSDDEEEDDDDDDDDEEGEDDDGDRNDSVTQHKKSPKSAAVVGVRIWTNELLVWLKMKYDMPAKLRCALAKVYYAICLCRGQSINLKIFVKTFEILVKDDNLLRSSGLILDWKPLFNEFNNCFPSVDGTVEKLEKKENKWLLRLAELACDFFEPEALPSIYDNLGQHLSTFSAPIVICYMSLMPVIFSKDGADSIYDIRKYIASFFYVWSKYLKNPEIESHLTSFLGSIPLLALYEINENGYYCIRSDDPNERNNFGTYGVFTKDQIQTVLNNLLNSLGLLEEKFGSRSTNFYHGFSCCLIYSINGASASKSEGIIENIQTVLNAIESYVHPSNSGNWSKPISKFLSSLVYQFHKRYNSEHQEHAALYNVPENLKLNKTVTRKFVEIILPLVKTGLQSKKLTVSSSYMTSLGLLAYLDPELVLESVLLDLYESLEGVISTHRVNTALKSLDGLVRYFASTKVYRVHLVRLLLLALHGIDSNDLDKSLITLDLFQVVANYVPFYDLSSSGDEDTNLAIQFTLDHIAYLQAKVYDKGEVGAFEVTDELELEALKSSTSAFKTLIKSFIQKIFTLLENIPDPTKSGGSEKTIADMIPRYLYVILEALSDDILKEVRKMVFDYVFDNTIYPVSEVFACMCGALIKRDPSVFPKYCELLILRIREEIEENGSATSRTGIDIIPRDQSLYWFLTILNECIGNASEYVTKSFDDLRELIFFLMTHVKGSTVFSASYLINHTLQSITKIKMKEMRLISPADIEKNGATEKCWGGFFLDPYRFSEENTTFDWFLPSEKEVKLAVDLFVDLSSKIIGNILSLMKNYNQSNSSSLDMTDEFRNNFLYLSYTLSGVAYLLDPSFEEDIPKLNQHENETIQQRLLLLKQLRSVREESKGSEESRIENLQENLQKIVDDMSNENLMGYDIGKELDIRIHDREASHEAEKVDKDSRNHLQAPKTYHSRSQSASPERSSRASPSVEGVSVSEMNPGITFRERKLYTSRYFFGDDMETRRTSDLYIKLHRFRYSIGRSLHIICKFLTTHLHDNPKLFKHFLYVLDIWISEVGRARLLDSSHIRVDYSYINYVQKINRVRKPFTRIAIGARLESYHLLRVALHSTSRTQTDLDKLLLEDLIKLSASTYTAVSGPAQASLMDAMKRLNGSYNVIIKSTIKYLTKALDEQNINKIISTLGIFGLKRIKNRTQNDYYNLQKIVNVLSRCLLVDSEEVNELSQDLFGSIAQAPIIPSSVCLINEKYIDLIKPPDAYIDLEIRAVKLAKEKKRRLYFEKLSKLESTIIANIGSSSHWLVSTLNLRLLDNLHLELETPLNSKALKLFALKAGEDHPIISRLAMKGIIAAVNSLYIKQLNEYQLKNCYDLEYINRDQRLVDTSGSYYDEWSKEINSSSPSYFIDSKADIGWYFWGKTLRVVPNEPLYEMKLEQRDQEALAVLGDLITKEWLLEIINFWVAGNDSTFSFQVSDVNFIAMIVLLISNGFCRLKFDELLSVLDQVYDKEDKSSHIVCCEIVGGLLIASKLLHPDLVPSRDEFVYNFLSKVIDQDLSPDTSGVWNVFSWWVPAHVDIRRFPKIAGIITNFKIDKSSDFAIKESTRVGYTRSLLLGVTWKAPHVQDILEMCLENINHHYQAVRDQIGCLLSVLSYAYYPDSVKDFETFLDMCNNGKVTSSVDDLVLNRIPAIFQQTENWRIEVEALSSQEMLKSDYIYSATTLLTWLKYTLSVSISVTFEDEIVPHIMPFLLKLTNLKEVCQLGNINPIEVLKLVSQIKFHNRNIPIVIEKLQELCHGNQNVIQLIVIGEFIETFYFKNLIKLTHQQRESIIMLVNELLFHKQVRVRESAASTLSGLIHISPPSEVDAIIKKFTSSYRKSLNEIRRKNKQSGLHNLPAEDVIILHGATLGLGSLIHAFSFLSPPPSWVPELLTILATKCSGIPGVVGKTAKESLGKFKKTRQDTWHIDLKVFSEAQMQDLEGVLIKSYFI